MTATLRLALFCFSVMRLYASCASSSSFILPDAIVEVGDVRPPKSDFLACFVGDELIIFHASDTILGAVVVVPPVQTGIS